MEMSILVNISKNLTQLMDMNAINASKLAVATGVPPSTIKKIRNSESVNPTIATLIPIVNYFGITIDVLISAQRENYFENKGRPSTVPVFSWNSLHANKKHVASYTYNDDVLSENSFAVLIPSNIFEDKYPNNTLLYVDPTLNPNHKDVVLVHNGCETFIKNLLIEGDYKYLSSMVIHNHFIPYSKEYVFLGVVTGYKANFKRASSKVESVYYFNEKPHDNVEA